MMLQQTGAVQTVRNRETRYFPGEYATEDAKDIALLRRGRVLEVAVEILRGPGTVQRELTERLKISRRVFRLYANLLMQRNLVSEERQGPSVLYFPTDRLAPVVKRIMVAEPSSSHSETEEGSAGGRGASGTGTGGASEDSMGNSERNRSDGS